MSRLIRILFTLLGVVLLAAYFGLDRHAVAGSQDNLLAQQPLSSLSADTSDHGITRDFGKLPLYFTAAPDDSSERGERFYSFGNRYGLSLTRSGAELRLLTE